VKTDPEETEEGKKDGRGNDGGGVFKHKGANFKTNFQISAENSFLFLYSVFTLAGFSLKKDSAENPLPSVCILMVK